MLAAGRRPDAERAAASAETLRAGGRAALRPRQLAELALAAVAPDGEQAASHALAAVAELESAGHVHDAARAHLAAGRGLANAGRAAEATAELERAAADFGSFGAVRLRAEAERELRKLGRAVHRRSAAGTADDGIAALTERELQLARLVVDRKTNPEIAAELYLSVKTVETHLRNIFRKVGVSSRSSSRARSSSQSAARSAASITSARSDPARCRVT